MDIEYHELSDIFPMMNDDEYQRLKLSINTNGLSYPIIIFEGKILDGRNRYKACQELGIIPKYEEYKGNNPINFVILSNLDRRHLNESQRSMVGARLANMKQGERTDLEPSANLRNVSQIEASEILNVGDRSIQYAKKVITEGTPELAKIVDDGKVAVSLAAKVTQFPEEKQEQFVKKIEEDIKPSYAIKEIAREIEKEIKSTIEPQTIPNCKYDVIVIDPPWELEKIQRDVRPNQQEFDYPTMTIDEIKKFPLTDIASDNCILFLWTIDKYLYQAREILEIWGFKYHLTMAWDKQNGISLFGFNRRTEFILVGFKGSHDQYPNRQTIKTSFSAKSEFHSAKPDIFYEMLEVLEGNKIDIFARKKREGWAAYGNEVS